MVIRDGKITGFIMNTQGAKKEVARGVAKTMMSRLPRDRTFCLIAVPNHILKVVGLVGGSVVIDHEMVTDVRAAID